MEVEPDRDDTPCGRTKDYLQRDGLNAEGEGQDVGCGLSEPSNCVTEARECATSIPNKLQRADGEIRFVAPPLLLIPSLDEGSGCEWSEAIDGLDSLSPPSTGGASDLFEDDSFDETKLMSFPAFMARDAPRTTEPSDVQASKQDTDENFMTSHKCTGDTGDAATTENDENMSIIFSARSAVGGILSRAIGSSPILKLYFPSALSVPRRPEKSVCSASKRDQNKSYYPVMLEGTTTFIDPFPTPTRKSAFSFDYDDAYLFETPRRRLSFSSLITESTMESDSESTSTEFARHGNCSEAAVRRRSLGQADGGGLARCSADDALMNPSSRLGFDLQTRSADGRPLRIRLASSSLRRSLQKTRKRIRRLRLRRRERPTSWLIPAEHPIKVGWDVCTVILSMISAYLTHTSIRDRDYDKDKFLIRFCEIWFLVDILLNFMTQHRTGGRILFSVQSVWARYLTTWFIIDVISFLPWERVWVKPIIEMQKRRNIVQKTKRRSKVIFKITRMLRGRHIRWFRHVTRHTKCAGVGSRRLIGLIIKYIPKYFTFCKNMRAVLAVRFLRQIHWVRKVAHNRYWKGRKVDGEDESEENVLEEVEEVEEEEVEEEENGYDDTGESAFLDAKES